MNTRRTAIITALIMLFSSLAGCLDRDEETKETAMVSTYHVGQLVSAIAGDTINVEMMSTANVPVHDYEPSAEDIVRLQESDIFFYHGLNLEPWVSSTLSTLGEKAPTSIQTHTMPTGEIDLAFEALLISDLCDLLSKGPYESTTLGHNEHDEHEHDEAETDDSDEDDAHEEHHHAEAEKIIQNPEGCPTDTEIAVFHMEKGEHVLEFEDDHNDAFNMAVLKMPGGHAHHHHHHGDGAYEWAGIFEISDASHTWSMQKVDGAYADQSMRLVLIPTTTPDEATMHTLEDAATTLIQAEDCTVVEDTESITSIASDGSCFELHVGTGDDSTYTIDTTGLTGLAVFAQHVPTEFERDQHYLKNSAGADVESVAQEGGGTHDHDNHDDKEGGACHNTDTHEDYDSTKEDCEAAGHQWNEGSDHEGGVCHNTTTHEDYDTTEADCEAAGHMWKEAHNYPEIHADFVAHSLTFPEEENHTDDTTTDEEENHHEPGYVVLHVEEEGDYGFAVPKDVEFYVLAEEPGAYEWAGIFEISDASHTWSMQKVDGAYADQSMRLVLIPTTTPDEATMHTLEDAATTLIQAEDCTVVEDTESITSIASDGSCFELHVGTGDDSTYTIDTTGLTGLAVFAQHVPTEFERDQHYLKNSAGADVESVAQESTGGHDHDHGSHGEEGEIEAEGEEAFEYDPHSWLDPLAFKEQAKVVLDALKAAFPEHESTFTSNAESYMSQLDSLHADFLTALPSDSTCTDTKVIANHNAYSYLAKRYDLKFISIHGIDPEGEPSAADIAEAVEEIKEDGLTVLFIEEYTSVSAVDSIVEQTTSDTMPGGVSIQYLYTMEMAPKDSSDDYISMMRKSMNNLKDGLGC